ncbi:hypothetical protein IC582_029550 [Cucumis melo]|uniref:Uncharacterized protein n=1 Tax=Cucumis melo TaxID=3656 RepID=A0A9I9CEK5_CUCME
MDERGIMGPKRSQFSPKPNRKRTDPEAKKSANKHPKKGPIVPSSLHKKKPQAAATNPNPNGNKTNSSFEPSSPAPDPPPTPISTPKAKSQPTTPSSHPPLPQTLDHPRKTKSQPPTPSSSSKINVVRRIDSENSIKASPKTSPTSWSDRRQKHVKNTADPNAPAYSDPSNDIGDRLLQRLSFEGKDLEDILQGNSIDDLMGSNNKKEESSPRNNSSLAILQIYQKIASHRQGNLSVARYFKKLKKLWDEIGTHSSDLTQGCSSNGTIEFWSELTERDKVIQFFVGLNDYYSTICSQILVKQPFPTVEEAYSEIIREEKRRELFVALGIVVAKVIQSNRLPSYQNGSFNTGDNNNLGIDQEIDRSN